MVAIAVDQALAVAEQIAFTLQPRIEVVGIIGIAPRQAGIVDLDSLAQFDAAAFGGAAHGFFAADQDGGAELLVDEADGGADDLFLLPLGEDHPLRRTADALEDSLQSAGDRVAPGR